MEWDQTEIDVETSIRPSDTAQSSIQPVEIDFDRNKPDDPEDGD